MNRLAGGVLALLILTAFPAMAEGDGVDGKFSYTPKKGLVFKTEDGKFKFHLSNRVQVRFTEGLPDDAISKGSFRVRRWKFKMDGYAFEHWKYKLQVNFAAGSVEGDNDALLEDAYLQYTKMNWVQPFMGQGKAWFSRQALNSSGKLQFVDRSIAASGDHGEIARQIGVGLVGHDKKKRFEYNFGIYNGDGTNSINKKENENEKFLYVGRFVWTPFGEYKLDEVALDRPDKPKLAVGIKAAHDTLTEEYDPGAPGTPFDVDRDLAAAGAEFAFKIKGFSMVTEYFRVVRQVVDPSSVQGNVILEDIDEDDYYIQGGYLFANNLEIAARYAVFDPRTTVSLKEQEVGAALNYYFSGHDYKLQADYRRLTFDGASDKDTDVIRVQAQFVF